MPKNNIKKVNVNNSNTDGSFTMADSNSFFSPWEYLPIALESKYLVQSTLDISASPISNNRLSRSENLIPVLT